MRVHTGTNLEFVIEIAFAFLFVGGVSFASDTLPTWAYGTQSTAGNVPSGAAAGTNAGQALQAKADDSLKHLPGSASGFTQAQINDPFGQPTGTLAIIL